MPYTKNLDYRDVANARISARMKQVLVLALAIVVGMLISVSVNAQGQVKDNASGHSKNIEQTLLTP